MDIMDIDMDITGLNAALNYMYVVRPKISEDSMLLPVTRYGKRLIDACTETMRVMM